MRPKSIKIITAPATEPITSAEAKLHCRVDTDADDTIFTALIEAARQACESETQRALISQTLEATYSAWPENGQGIWIPKPPLTSVTSVKYYDGDGVEQTLSTDIYEVDTASEPGVISLKYGQTWPSLQGDKLAPITVRYVTGYANAAAVPDSLRVGMLLCIGHWYKHREEVMTGTIVAKTPFAAETLFGLNAARWGY